MKFHVLANGRNLLRLNLTEPISPGSADVGRDGGDLLIVQHLAKRRHDVSPHQDLADHIVGQAEEAILAEARSGTAEAELTVTGEATCLLVDIRAVRALGRFLRACFVRYRT